MAMQLKVPPLVIALLTIILMVALSYVLPVFSFSLRYGTPLSIVVGFIGIAIAGSGVMAFRRLRTTTNPIKPEKASALAVEGIYRRTRNPMYLGVVFFLVACGIYLANFAALLIGPAGFAIYMNQFQIKPEEQALSLIFGEEFVRYMARVRRWL